jgi:pimeloyl-ACP methyl ester carboxylesterase/protein-S-isoprenylcysteine O-methyltransferase Ste14
MPWIRGLIFTVLIPGTVALYVPFRMAQRLTPPGGFWEAGWLVSAVGAIGYFWCFLGFLASGGTPAIFFTRPVRFLLGEEPRRLVQNGLYRISRNPMYVSVLLVIFGQAIRWASWPIAEYGLFVWLGFHIVVVVLEEPHLLEERGPSYQEYCRRVPRWFLRLRFPGVRPPAASIAIAATLFGCAPSPRATSRWRDPSPHKMQFVEVQNDVRLEVLDWGGPGRPAILLAGSGLSAHIYDDFAPRLAAYCHVYAISRRGYGESSKPEFGYDNRRLADDIFEVADRLKLKAPVLIGHSMAGGEITTVANAHSDRLGGLVYLEALGDPKDFPASDPAYMALARSLPPSSGTSSPTGSDALTFAGYQAWQLRTQRAAFPESELHYLFATNQDGSRGGFQTSPAIYRALGEGDVRRDYSKIRVPVLALVDYPRWDDDPWRQGRNLWRPGEMIPKTAEERAALKAFVEATAAYVDRWMANLRTSVPGARIVDLPGAGHFLFISRESEVLSEIAQFLQTLK